MGNLTYEDYKQRLTVQDLLKDAGYVQNRRDGLRYPSFVRLDSDGRRIRGDKFIVTQNGQCCFQPPEQKSYNIISLIKEHPDYFCDYQPGMNLDLLVNKVCSRLLNWTYEEKSSQIREPPMEVKQFSMDNYEIHRFNPRDRDSQKAFYPYFKHRGIDLTTQYAFRDHFVLATKVHENGKEYRNLSFLLTIPGKGEDIVGFEERGRMRRNGEKPYKGKAEGSNGSEGLWMASPGETRLDKAKRVFLFESAYDAIAYFQLKHGEDKELRKAVFVSTGGNPTLSQMKGLVQHAPEATFHICFDNDMAGKQFTENFMNVIRSEKPYSEAALKFLNTKGNIEIDEEKEEAFSRLPKEVRELYFKAQELREELRTSHLCPEERDKLAKESHELLQKFHGSVAGLIIRTQREAPCEVYKDWNDELLNQSTEKQTAGVDLDGNGTIETDEATEETRRYHR